MSVATFVSSRWFVAALFVVITFADLVTARGQSLGALFSILPVLVAVNGGRRAVVAAGAVGVVLAALLSWYNHDAGQARFFARFIAVVGATGLGLVLQAVRVDRETRLARAQRIADVVQRALLPVPPHRVGPFDVAATYASAAHDAQVGGDLYDVVDTGSGLRAVIGDVRGKGLPAVRISGGALGVFRAVGHDERNLPLIAHRMEYSVLREAGPEDFVTVLLVEVTTGGRCTLLSYGHPPPLVRNVAGEVREAPVAAHPPIGLGLLRDPAPEDRGGGEYGAAGGPGDSGVVSATDPAIDPLAGAPGGTPARTTELILAPGDELLLVTDGALEARNAAGEFYPLAPRYAACLGPDDPPAEVLAALNADMRVYCGGELDDDSALVLLRYTPPLPGERSSSAGAGAVPPR
ncbi:PP2C family protein-serine/threonine phosphatase [Streptomyces sp. CMB-StM0423]|uniref:PP2C family protein-serine/threonine phosphatase n=1 Tax=Streptomyces sp. CMB-StM0423 TaxID=2059884 RepID=UPI000C70CD5E|nr:PP2C family protein-serine/threonine phosphatase [Streptomyces sp. CMB-StM0423]AUH39425.1 serine/threonine-protein phosphatase [Streptomyces sp. CMB-StM0423]